MTSDLPAMPSTPRTHSQTGERLSGERVGQKANVASGYPITSASGEGVTGVTLIDTDSEPGAWAETLASPSCKIITQHRQQIGPVAVTFTMGRIVPKQKQERR